MGGGQSWTNSGHGLITGNNVFKKEAIMVFIKTGDKINIPFILSQDFVYYEVEKGDILKNIANEKKVDLKVLAHLNGLSLEDYIYPKQILIVPKENVKIYITEAGDTIKDLELQVLRRKN